MITRGTLMITREGTLMITKGYSNDNEGVL